MLFGIFVFVFNRFLFSPFSFVLVFIIFFVLVLVFVNENHTGGSLSSIYFRPLSSALVQPCSYGGATVASVASSGSHIATSEKLIKLDLVAANCRGRGPNNDGKRCPTAPVAEP